MFEIFANADQYHINNLYELAGYILYIKQTTSQVFCFGTIRRISYYDGLKDGNELRLIPFETRKLEGYIRGHICTTFYSEHDLEHLRNYRLYNALM